MATKKYCENEMKNEDTWFKIASNMVDSFEFYDLSPIFVESKNKDSNFIVNSTQEIEFIELNAEYIQMFDHVLYW